MYTITIVNLAWVIFRSDSISDAIIYIGNMFGIGTHGFYDSSVIEYLSSTIFVLLIALFASTPLYKKAICSLKYKRLGWIEAIIVFCLFILSLLQVISTTYNPFIYFNF